MNWSNNITSNPNVMFGKPVIKGTRIPVELVIEKLANKYTIQDLLEVYSQITNEDIQACLQIKCKN